MGVVKEVNFGGDKRDRGKNSSEAMVRAAAAILADHDRAVRKGTEAEDEEDTMAKVRGILGDPERAEDARVASDRIIEEQGRDTGPDIDGLRDLEGSDREDDELEKAAIAIAARTGMTVNNAREKLLEQLEQGGE